MGTFGIRVTSTASVYVLPLQTNKRNIFTQFRHFIKKKNFTTTSLSPEVRVPKNVKNQM